MLDFITYVFLSMGSFLDYGIIPYGTHGVLIHRFLAAKKTQLSGKKSRAAAVVLEGIFFFVAPQMSIALNPWPHEKKFSFYFRKILFYLSQTVP